METMKSNKNLFDQIELLIQGLQRIIQCRNNENESLSRIEIDLALEKVRNVYDLLLMINAEDTGDVNPEPVIVEELVKPDMESNKAESTVAPVESENGGRPQKITDAVATQPIAVSKEDEKSEISATKTNRSHEPDLFSGSAVTFASDTEKTIAEKLLEENQSETLADKMSSHKIEGLRNAIGINDKFFFINELFQGNLKDYNDAINNLDQAVGIDQAIEKLEILAEKNQWNRDETAFRNLLGFVERRFK